MRQCGGDRRDAHRTQPASQSASPLPQTTRRHEAEHSGIRNGRTPTRGRQADAAGIAHFFRPLHQPSPGLTMLASTPTQSVVQERRRHPRADHTGTPPDSGALLELRDFGVAFGKKVVLSEISLIVPEHGATVLLGPTGTGKSTLLRTLAGLSSASPSFRSWGEVFYRGAVLEGQERPELVAQSAKLLMSSVLENVVVSLPERNQLTRVM